MSINSTIEAKAARLGELMGAVEDGSADAMAEATKLADELDELKERKAAADRFAGLVGSIGATHADAKGNVTPKAKGFGAFVADAMVGKFVKGSRMSLSTGEWGTKTASTMDTPAAVAPWATVYDSTIVEQPRRRLTIADLLGTESIGNSNAVSYLVESATVDAYPTAVAEGAAKPQISFGDPTPVTETLHKLAAYYKESDELLEDYEWLASNIENRAIYQLMLLEENQLLNGNGTAPNLTGILNRNGIQTASIASANQTAAGIADAIFAAMMDVQDGSGFDADGIVINPANYQTLRLGRDGNQQYYGGGYFQGEYGNGNVVEQPPIWGVRTVVTSAITAGTILVGNFRQAASVFRKGGLRVEATNTNEDDFTKNLVTVRVEERLGLAVRYPAAFKKLTLAS